MSPPLGTYSFLPWLRQGVANRIAAADFDPTVKVRATMRVDIELSGEGVSSAAVTETVGRDVSLYGPGDIVGIDPRAIVRVEPRNWITNFEPNYLAHVEFYDEDFPWRYTPAAPDVPKHRLRPWIALLVLAEDEFEDGTDILGRPLPYIEVADLTKLPPAPQLWAWAHVHVNRSLAAADTEIVSNDMNAVLPRFQSVLAENPDLAYSRLVCPRKLGPNAAYHAFVVPVFETGRLAGLGLDATKSPHATFSAWEAYPAGTREQPQNLPYYHRWFFRTGAAGDFETLVRLLQPRPADTRVGRRDMDVQRPGANLPGIADPTLHGVLRLGGALQVPRANYTPAELVEVDHYENWDTPYPRPFQTALARFINLADGYAAASAAAANAASGLGPGVAGDPDPLITPPLYGTWHALTRRLLRERDGQPVVPDDNWVHELNLDPRHRVAAGFGTRVVQEQQEKYMDAAWEQIGKVLEANRRIRLGQAARAVSRAWYERHLEPLVTRNGEKAFLLTAPVHRRVVASGFTVHHLVATSPLTPAMTSVALRRAVRPRARLVRALPFDDTVRPDTLLARVNAGEATAAPPKTTPPGVVTVEQVADGLGPAGAPGPLVDLLRRWPWLRWVPLALAVALLLLVLGAGLGGVGLAVALGAGAALVGAWWRLTRWTRTIRAADGLREANLTPAAVDALPPSPDFTLSAPGAGVTPSAGSTDSVEAVRFKTALRASFGLIQASAAAAAVPPRVALDLPAVTAATVRALDPRLTVPRRIWQGVTVPPRIRAEIGEELVEAMAYPEFDTPMYEPLKNISAELFLPNLHLIEPNSITLLMTNQAFIEAYMVGLNHEFARELLWREYPTDQRGSYFRQFWDVSGDLAAGAPDGAARRERLRDIPPLDRWPRASRLGDHDHREAQGDKEEEVVLVIRGELLKRYPTAVIYAHRARWQRKTDGGIDPSQERRLEELTPAEEAAPPRSKVRTPLYEAKVDPDIYFFGFDLTAEVARGGTGERPTDDPGWFFVIEERPGDPRFGLDTDQQPTLQVWGDLSWTDVQPGSPGSYLEVTGATPTLTLQTPTGPDSEKLEQYENDRHVTWSKDMSAADLAYILLQMPVQVAIHAAEMLGKP